MADTVFRVEVGAKIGVSTANLKKDIQGILDKMPARKIAIQLDTAQSRKNLSVEISKLRGQYSIPVELAVKGSGLSGTSGKNFKQAIRTITQEINKQQAAKITLHIDTAATQKAMLAELKKLNLGVTITPGNTNQNGGRQVDEYAKAWKQVVALQASANAKAGRDDAVQAQGCHRVPDFLHFRLRNVGFPQRHLLQAELRPPGGGEILQ